MIRFILQNSQIKKILNALNALNFSSESVLLGRWEHRLNENQIKIKSTWTNSDHCGDFICGSPILVKEILEQTENKKKV